MISAYNEAESIKEKIVNCLEFDYPKGRLEILIASDGSTDDTLERIRSLLSKNVKYFKLPRGGKARALNIISREASGDVFVFTDANAILSGDALKRVVACLNDPSVGCVSTMKKIMPKDSAVGKGESAYWVYEYFVKKHESLQGTAVGADGAFYALKREYFVPIKDDKNIADDLAISITTWQFNKRIILAESVFSYERADNSIAREFYRKVRIAEGSYRAVTTKARLLNPFTNKYWLGLYSHKIIRWAGPFLFAGMMLISVMMMHDIFYFITFVLMVLTSLIGLCGLIYPRNIPIVSTLGHFGLSNIAQAYAFIQFLFKPRSSYWETRTG
jgi:cellulose synthase/poly-beta-1,6-N-acetylglucosamine synthase-like glycosyltransferase